MHRLHHRHADTPEDPHSPGNVGIAGIWREQLRSYERALVLLIKGHRASSAQTSDLGFGVHWLYRRGFWPLPFLVHAATGAGLALAAGSVPVGIAWFVGLSSHPVQGWAVNALSHTWGSRRFETADNSRNNQWVGWLVFGEGYQNNHHAHPRSPRLSCGCGEMDFGWGLVKLCACVGLLRVSTKCLIPRSSLSADVPRHKGRRDYR